MYYRILLVILLLSMPQDGFAKDEAPFPKASKANGNPRVSNAKQTLTRPIKDKWALLIGISKFEDKSIAPLRFAAKDADDFCNFLCTRANFKRDHILLLKDSQASKENILEAVGDGWLPQRVQTDDLVVIFISTHGSAPDKVGDNFIVAADSKAEKLYSTGIRLQDLPNEITRRTGCDRLVMLLDACHSGAAEVGGKGMLRSAGNVDVDALVGTGQIVISSSQKDEISWESKRHDNSVFTACLIDALQSKGSNTKITEAFDLLQNKVEQEVRFDRKTFQRPKLRSKWQGDDLVLSAKPSTPREILPELPEETNIAKEPSPISSAGSSQQRPIRDKWALVIGTSKFLDARLNLRDAGKDAQDFHNYLVNEAGFARDHVLLLQDEKATRMNILSAIGSSWLPRQVLPGDLVVVYFSGHSNPVVNEDEGNSLLCYDSDPRDLYSSGIALSELTRMIKNRIQGDRIVLILDTSCSSSLSSAADASLVDRKTPAQEVLFMTSCRHGQKSWESKQYRNSIFTHWLLEGLRQRGKETTITEAFLYASKHVEEEAGKDYGARQTPAVVSKGEIAKLILAAPATQARTATP